MKTQFFRGTQGLLKTMVISHGSTADRRRALIGIILGFVIVAGCANVDPTFPLCTVSDEQFVAQGRLDQ